MEVMEGIPSLPLLRRRFVRKQRKPHSVLLNILITPSSSGRAGQVFFLEVIEDPEIQTTFERAPVHCETTARGRVTFFSLSSFFIRLLERDDGDTELFNICRLHPS